MAGPTLNASTGKLVKEPHYFDRVPLASFDEYLDMFGVSSAHRPDDGAPGHSSITWLDGTPDYLHIPSSVCRIASAFPKAKLIAVLKDPVQRALSGWNMARHKEPGTRSLKEEVRQTVI